MTYGVIILILLEKINDDEDLFQYAWLMNKVKEVTQATGAA